MKKTVHKCDKCGRKKEFYVNPEWLLSSLSPTEANMVALLLEARRKKVGITLDQMIRAAYIEFEFDPSKIPTDANQSIQSLVYRMNEKISKLGWRIATPMQTKCGYWLVPLV